MQARHAATVLTLAVMMLLALVGPSSAEPRVVDLAIRNARTAEGAAGRGGPAG